MDSLNSYTANVLPGVWSSCADFTTVVNGLDAPIQFAVAPNPTSGSFTVTTAHAFRGGRLSVLDASGRMLVQHPIAGTTTTIDIRALQGSLLFVQLTHADGSLAGVQRLVVTR